MNGKCQGVSQRVVVSIEMFSFGDLTTERRPTVPSPGKKRSTNLPAVNSIRAEGRKRMHTILAASTHTNPPLYQANPCPNETTGNSTPADNEILASIAIDPCLDGLEPNGNEFIFNMEGLRWLDAVQ
jgi:hypothetical protein